MATRKRKRFWNEGGIPGLGPDDPPHVPPPPAERVPVPPATGLVFSPRPTQLERAPTDEETPAAPRDVDP